MSDVLTALTAAVHFLLEQEGERLTGENYRLPSGSEQIGINNGDRGIAQEHIWAIKTALLEAREQKS